MYPSRQFRAVELLTLVGMARCSSSNQGKLVKDIDSHDVLALLCSACQ